MINYYLLTKPGIIAGNLVTVLAGFIMGTTGHFDLLLFVATMVGIACIIASACVFNNYIDRHVDTMMSRTKHRALVLGLISGPNALAFGMSLGVLGALILYAFTNLIAVGVAAIGFFVYVFLYSFWKCRTVYGTAIGSIAGAVPPVVGYCAASDRFDAAALILFTMMILWQMPHFFAIALYHYDDYKNAGIPILPIARGIVRTKIHMFLYILAFIPITLLLTYYDYTGMIFLTTTLLLGCGWLLFAALGFRSKNDRLWGRQMFRYSLVIINAICLIITVGGL